MRKNDCVELVLEAIDECYAAGTITKQQRRQVRLCRLMNPGKFRKVCDGVCADLEREARADGLALDPDNVRQWLDLLLEYLPQIIALFTTLFAQ